MRYFFIVVNFFLSLLLIGGHLSAYVDPDIIVYPAYLAIGMPYLLGLNVLFMIVWLIRTNKYFLISLISLIICFSSVIKTVSFNKTLPDSPKKAIKILTYNVKIFDLYNWSHERQQRIKILRIIDSIDADIICLQEFYEGVNQKYKNIDTLLKITGTKYYYFNVAVRKPYGFGDFGIILLSRFPIIDTVELSFPGKTSNSAAFADVILPPNDTIRLYNLHLQSIKIDPKELDNVSEINSDEKKGINSIVKILRLMKKAFIKRSAQAEIISESIKNSPYPLILCGDFNDTPYSNTYYKIKGELIDSYENSGSWFGSTVFSFFPLLRIDNILYSKNLHSFGYKALDLKASDHKPVYVYVEKLEIEK